MRTRAFGAAAVLSLLAGCMGKSASSNVRTAVAGPAMLRDVARLTGTVEPSDTIQIKSQVTQQILHVLAKEGDFVKKGQLLFDLDREQLQLKHEQLVIAVSSANLTLKSADRDLSRAQVQIQNGSVSADHVQDLEIARDKSRLSLKNAQLDLKSNERDLYYTRITAPRDGQLIRLPVTEGEMAVTASSASGNVLGVIADPTRLKVVVEVSELDYPRLKLGQKVEISTEAQPNKLLQGRVTYIPPSASPSASNTSVMVFKVEVTIDQNAAPVKLSDVAGARVRGGSGKVGSGDTLVGRTGKPGRDSSKSHRAAGGRAAIVDSLNTALAPGMTVNVDFVFLERKVEIAVPYDMVTSSKDGARKMLRVRDEKGLHPKPVQIGSTDFKSYEILTGVSAGDTVFAAEEAAAGGAKGNAPGPGGPH